MTTIASLGLQIDSGDAVEAKDNLDQLTDAGKRSEESAGRTGRAWETALGSLQGDTRQIVQELQALNAKQTELAQQMATVGRAVTSASTAFSSAAANMGAFRTEAAQAGKVQEALTTATDAGAQAGRRAAESADEQQARILAVAKASLEASQYVQSLNRATEQSAEVTAKANAVLSDSASRQASINSRAQALIATEERQAEAAKKAAGAHREEGQALEDLLGKIDPTVAAMSRLDQMEQKLKGFRTSGALDAETFGEYQAKIDQARTALGGADAALNKTGMSAKATAAALRGVPAQFTDIVVSLQGGQAPLTVLLQQGGQLKDMFGGVGPAAKAMGGYIAGLISPLTLSAAAVTGLAVAVVAGIGDLNEFNKALASTGGVAGKSSSQLVDLQNKLANGKYFSQANEALLALVGSGKLTGETFDAVAGAATQLSAASGESAGKFAQMFVEAKSDVTAFALEFNSKYHAVTLATFDQIQALEDQGRHMDALKLLAGEVSEEMTRRNEETSESTRGIAKLWDDATSAVRRYWNELKQGVAADPDQFRMQVLQQQVADIEKQFWFSDSSRDALKKQYTDEIALIQKRIDAGAKERQDRADGEAAIQKQADLQKKLNDQLDQANPERKRAKALQDLKQRFIDLREAAKETGKQSPLLAGVSFDGDKISGGAYDTLAKGIADRNKDKVGKTSPIDLSGFNDQKHALSAILAEYKNHQKELDAAQKAGLISQESYAAQRAAIIEQQKAEVTNAYEGEIKALEGAKGRSSTSAQQRIQLDQKIADTRAAMVKAQKDADTELSVLATNEQGRLAKQARAVQTYTDALDQQVAALRLQGQRAADGLGLGDRQRGLQDQQNGITDRMNQQRLDLANQYGDGSRGMSLDEYNQKLAALSKTEKDLQETTIANYDQMTAAQGDWRKGASSAFQNYLEQARDVAGQTKTLFSNAFSSMEDAVVNFAMTGKFSFADFTKSILADMVRIETQRAASGLLSSLAGWGATAASAWFGGGTTSAGSTQAGYSPEIMDSFVSGQRAGGGPVAANSLYQVNELGPELLNQGGKTYLMMGEQGGTITPLGTGPASTLAKTSTSGTMISVSAPVNVAVADRSDEGMELDQTLLQQNMQKQMQLAAEKAVADSWRPGGVSYRNTKGGR
ncbi:phage tail tape measure protein [Pseudomonas asiatica]|uniref:phage tail tape measure protein n=1 Tax=Pseudomonas asiatica TaxID=2219225 RepID=UPI001E63E656|nr:phage tail tape measure protein [Pseudomonas asiatica]MCE0853797.1 phage tail tape measure protein [Pseudomonas asiatica]